MTEIAIVAWVDLLKQRGLALDAEGNAIFFPAHTLEQGINLEDIRSGYLVCITTHSGFSRTGDDVRVVDLLQWPTREEAIEAEGVLRDVLHANRIEQAAKKPVRQ